jgi:hypothetical protein
LQSINVAGRYWVYYPEEIILMTKALVTIEGVANLLCLSRSNTFGFGFAGTNTSRRAVDG